MAVTDTPRAPSRPVRRSHSCALSARIVSQADRAAAITDAGASAASTQLARRSRWMASTSAGAASPLSAPTITNGVASPCDDGVELLAQHLRRRAQEPGVEIRRPWSGEPERYRDVRLDGLHLVGPERRDVEGV